MEHFALSERWCGWKNVDAIFTAARAAIEAGPFDPPVCEVVFDADFEPLAIHSLEEASEYLRRNPGVISMEISVSHIDDDEARIMIEYNGHWLQLNGYGSDWERARQAYYAAQVELALVYGITTFRLPELPYDTVAETRRKQELADLERALEQVDEGPIDQS